jgi:hypothetical protein
VLFYSLVLGGIFLPASQYFFLFFSSTISVPSFIVRFFNLVTASWVVFAVLNAFKLLFTAAFGGAVFGPCGWLIDKFSTATHKPTSKYVPIGFASLIAIGAVAFAAFAPEELLLQLGP